MDKKEKRKVSILVPYRKTENGITVYLQRRDKDAKRLPDHFGFFGGGAEQNERPEEALLREIKEELDYVPSKYDHFGLYEFEGSVKDIFITEAGEDFEKGIRILEGQYGKWFGEDEVLSEPKLIEEDKLVLRDLFSYINKNR